MSEIHSSGLNPQEAIKNYLNVPPTEDTVDPNQLREWALAARESTTPYTKLMAANMFYELANGDNELPDLLHCQLLLNKARQHNPSDMVRAQVLALHAEAGLRISLLDPNNNYRQSFLSYQKVLMLSGQAALKGSREAENLDSDTVNFVNCLVGSLLLANTGHYIGFPVSPRLSMPPTHSATAWNMRLWETGAAEQRRIRVGVQPGPGSHLLPPMTLLHEEYQAKRKTPFGTLQAIMDATELNPHHSARAQEHVKKAQTAILAHLNQPRDVLAEVAHPESFEAWYANLLPRQPYALFGSRLNETVQELQEKLITVGVTYQENLALGWVYSERANLFPVNNAKQAALDYTKAADIFSGLIQNTKPDEILHYQARLGRHTANIHSALLKVDREGVFKPKVLAEDIAVTAAAFLKNYDKLNPDNNSEIEAKVDTVLQTLAFGMLTASDSTESCIIAQAPPRQHNIQQGGWHMNALLMNHSGMFKAGFASSIRLAGLGNVSRESQVINEGVASISLSELIKEVTPKRKEVLSDIDFLELMIKKVWHPKSLELTNTTLIDAVHGKFMEYARFAGIL